MAARQLLAAPDDAREAGVAERDVVELAGLAAKAEPDGGSVDPCVRGFERGEAERAVAARVFLVADADQRLLEQRDDGGDDLVEGQDRLGEIARDAPANQRQCRGERGHAVVFRFVADLAPARVIAILLASPRVAAGGLEVS